MPSFRTTRFALVFASAHRPASKPPLCPTLRETTGTHKTRGWSTHGRYFSARMPNGASGSKRSSRPPQSSPKPTPSGLSPRSPSTAWVSYRRRAQRPVSCRCRYLDGPSQSCQRCDSPSFRADRVPTGLVGCGPSDDLSHMQLPSLPWCELGTTVRGSEEAAVSTIKSSNRPHSCYVPQVMFLVVGIQQFSLSERQRLKTA